MDVQTEYVCDCCASWLANNDESSCRDYWGHSHKRCDISYLWVLEGGNETYPHTWTCFGCESEILDHGNRWPVTYLDLN